MTKLESPSQPVVKLGFTAGSETPELLCTLLPLPTDLRAVACLVF